MSNSKFSGRSQLSVVLLVAILAILSGCATTPNPTDMLPTPKVTKKHTETVYVAATSMLETPATANGPISSAAIADAVTKGIDNTKLFSRVVDRNAAKYLLSTVLITNDTPIFAIDFTARCEMGWTLTKADGTVVWKEVLKSEGTANGDEAFVGRVRGWMARERAVRENITAALTKIGTLEF